MCAAAKVEQVWCDTQGSLKKTLGIDCLIYHESYDPAGFGDEYCICPVDMKQTANEAGFNCEYDDVFNWILTKK